MKTYCYWEYDDPPSLQPEEITEEGILDLYWEFWKAQMDKKFGPNYYLTTKEICIEEWVIVNWAVLKS